VPPTPVSPDDPDYKAFFAEGTARKAARMILDSTETREAASANPGEQVKLVKGGTAVGKDPATGEPVEVTVPDTVKSAGSDRPVSKMIGHSLNSIVSGYRAAGYLDKPKWDTVKQQLESDILGPMQESSREIFLSKNAQRIASLPADAREDETFNVQQRADEHALNGFMLIESAMHREWNTLHPAMLSAGPPPTAHHNNRPE
jgi:hypothetical protein